MTLIMAGRLRQTEGWLDEVERCQEKQDDRMKEMDRNMARVKWAVKTLENTINDIAEN
jgi:hypothetical protein